MEDDRLAVGGALDVAFDGKTRGDGGAGGAERVFNPSVPMPPAMGDRAGGQPVQGAISNNPSTSQMALSGRCATPTVVRACRPFSPKTSDAVLTLDQLHVTLSKLTPIMSHFHAQSFRRSRIGQAW